MATAVVLPDVTECVRDSPHFRRYLGESERTCGRLESHLERLGKAADCVTNAGQLYLTARQQLVHALLDTVSVFEQPSQPQPQSTASVTAGHLLSDLLLSLTALEQLERVMLGQLSELVGAQLARPLRQQVAEAREARHAFDRASSDLDSSLSRHAQLPRSKDTTEAAATCLTARRAFKHAALDYSHRLARLETGSRLTVARAVHRYYTCVHGFFSDGVRVCDGVAAGASAVSAAVDEFSQQSDSLETLLASRTTPEHAVNDKNNSSNSGDNSGGDGGGVIAGHWEEQQLVSADLPRHSVLDGRPLVDGYLYKRASNAFRTWSRRWFMLDDRRLMYQRRSGAQLSVVEADLRLCSVRVPSGGGGGNGGGGGGGCDGERRCCFELMSPSRSHVMQADSARGCQMWVQALQQAIGAALHGQTSPAPTPSSSSLSSCSSTSSPREISGGAASVCNTVLTLANPTTVVAVTDVGAGKTDASTTSCSAHDQQQRRQDALTRRPGNELCADCGHQQADWASINLGVTLCIECSGIHRSLGVHVSKVRSLTLDKWEPEVVVVFARLGNTAVNGVYEAAAAAASDGAALDKPSSTADRAAREHFIRAKYVQRRYVVTPCAHANVNNSGSGGENDDGGELAPGQTAVHALLYRAAATHDLPAMCQALACGADVNWRSSSGETALHAAIGGCLQYAAGGGGGGGGGSTAACQFLLLNGADAALTDGSGRTPLHRAVACGQMGELCVLLKHRVDQHACDHDGRTALQLAVARADADMVTVLRLARLSEQMRRDDEPAGDGDDTFNQVVRDFSLMAAAASNTTSASSASASSCHPPPNAT